MSTEVIQSHLKSWFPDSDEKIYSQVATTDDNKPHIRTMALQGITGQGELIFFTKYASPKWLHLKCSPNVAICILCAEGQIVAEGSAALLTKNVGAEKLRHYWDNVLDSYWRDFYLSANNDRVDSSASIPLSFGVILVKPVYLDILCINEKDYLSSERKIYRLKGGAWNSESALPL